jgi:hypothetical protein
MHGSCIILWHIHRRCNLQHAMSWCLMQYFTVQWRFFVVVSKFATVDCLFYAYATVDQFVYTLQEGNYVELLSFSVTAGCRRVEVLSLKNLGLSVE